MLDRQAQLNAALDLDKNETQIGPSAEDGVELAGEALSQLRRKRLLRQR